MDNIYVTPEHELQREQVARFIAREVEPYAAAWEEAGYVPREVLRKMGKAGLLGLVYESKYGGGEADALTNLVFAEALSQSTFGGFIITVLVHTDMASPHLFHAGTAAQKACYMLYPRDRHRAPVARCARAGHRWRRDGSHARRSGQAVLMAYLFQKFKAQ
jgi:acyl-CoA dehydrogenase